MNGMCCPIEIFMVLPLRGEFCESSQTPRTLSLAGRLSPFQGVHAADRTYNRPEGATSHQPNGNALGIAPKGHKQKRYSKIPYICSSNI